MPAAPYAAQALGGEPTSVTPKAIGGQGYAISHGPTETLGEVVSAEHSVPGAAPAGYPPDPEPQDAPFGADRVVTTNANDQTHTSVAIGTDGTTILVAYTNQTSPTNRDVYVARSMDGGATWTHTAVAANAGYNEWAPRIIRHASRIYVFYSHDDPAFRFAYRWHESTNNGQTWTAQQINFISTLRSFVSTDVATNGPWMYVVQVSTCESASPAACPVSPLPVVAVHMYDSTGAKSGGTSYHILYDGATYLPVFDTSIAVGDAYTVFFADADGNNLVSGCGAGERDLNTRRVPTGQNVGSPWPWIDNFVYQFCSQSAMRFDAVGMGPNIVATFQFFNTAVDPNSVIFSFYNPNNGEVADFNLAGIAGGVGIDFKDPAIFASNPLMHVVFVGGGDLFYTYSLDGGAMWSTPSKANANTGTVVDAMRSADLTYANGVRVVWQDNRNGNMDVMYSAFSGWAFYIFDRSPRQGMLNIDGIDVTVPTARLWQQGSAHDVIAPATENVGPGTRLLFTRWSDGNTNPTRTITTGATDVTLVAEYGTEYFLDMRATVGTTTPVSGWFVAGTPVTIEWIPPAPGPTVRYTFQGWTGSGPGSYTGTANPTSITMNGPITEVADAIEEFRFVIDTQPTNLNVIIDGGAPIAAPQTVWWRSGTTHTIQAVTPQQPAGPLQRYVFRQWLDGPTSPTRTIVVSTAANYTAAFDLEYQITFATNPPGRDVTINTVRTTTPATVWWKAGEVNLVDVPSPQMAGADTRYVYVSWSDGGAQSHQITAMGPMSLSVTFRTEYRFVFDTVPTGLELVVNGTAVSAPQTYWWTAGTTHTVALTSPQAAGPDSRRVFVQWSDGPLTNPRTFSNIAAPASLTVQTALEHRVRFDTVPSGVGIVINVNAVPITAPGEAWLRDGSSATIAATSPSPGATGVRYVWQSWSDNGAQSHPITVTGPATLTATYRTQYFLTVQTAYGAKTGETWYDAGMQAFAGVDADIVAGPTGTRYVFVQWTGDATGTTFSQSNPITMDGPKTATAQWKTQYFLTATSPYGNVTKSIPSGWYDSGTTATVTVAPLLVPDSGNPQGVRYAFVQWTGDATGGQGTGASSPITMDAPKTATAQWKTQYFLTAATGTTEPSVSITCSNADCWFDANSQATLTMSTNGVESVPGRTRVGFIRWMGAASGTNWQASNPITMDAPKSASAEWRTQHKLTIVEDRGVVTQTNADGWYTEGDGATLTLTSSQVPGAEGERFQFVRWTGGATGTGTTTTVSMTSPQTVTLEWKRQVRVRVVTSPSLAGVQATIGGTVATADGVYVDAGTTVTLSVPAEATSGGKSYRFVRWTGAVGGASTTLTPTDPVTVTAVYEEKGGLESPLVLGGLIAAIVAALLIAFLLLFWRRRKQAPGEGPEMAPAAGAAAVAPPPPPAAAVPPAPAAARTMECPSCGMTIPAQAGPCPVCGTEVKAPSAPGTDERVRRLEEAYKSGQISKEQYEANLKRLRGAS